MSTIGRWACALLALLALSVPLPAFGQDRTEAQRLFDAGEQAYDSGDFADAADHFEQSYRAGPRPRTLLRLAQSAEGAGQAERAVDTYKAYLVLYPDAPNRRSLEARIARLKGNPAPSRPAAAPATPAHAQRGTGSPDLPAVGDTPRRRIAQPSGDTRGQWTAEDEAWYRQNRVVRVAGRLMVALGSLLLVAGLAAGPHEDEEGYSYYSDKAVNTIFAGMGFYLVGSAVWAGSTLRGTNELRRRGVQISKVAAVLSVVGVFGPPILWVAGPMAGANMRRAYDDVARGSSRTAADWMPSLQYRVAF